MTLRSHWFFLITVAVALGGCQVSEDQLESWVKSQGYALIDPPSTLYSPGTLVYRTNYDPKKDANATKLTLGFLCDPDYSIALYAKQPRSSPTVNQATVTNFGGTISAGIPALSRLLALNAKLKAASTITADIHDVNIYSFALDDLESIRDVLGPRCRKIVNANVPNNAYQVSEVLQASVDVSVQIDGSASASAQALFLQQLGNLGFTVTAGQTATLKGKALFFGIRLMPITAPITAPTSTPVASVGWNDSPTKFSATRSAKERREARGRPIDKTDHNDFRPVLAADH